MAQPAIQSISTEKLTLAQDGRILIGKGTVPQYLTLKYANRHGLVAGATGTGKTLTLQVLAEGFSKQGVPVFACDVKGDLAGIAVAGATNQKIEERLSKLGGIEDFAFASCPSQFLDVFGEKGCPVRVTVSDMGPLLFSRLLGLSGAQEGVLQVAFAMADAEGMLLLDLKDLKAILQFMSEHKDTVSKEYGLVSPTSIAAIQRALLTLEQEGASQFFGEPALELYDLMRVDQKGQGVVSVLAAEKLYQQPMLYASFLLWLLSELFENLPEAGDLDRPKIVLFFDEAHLLFEDAPKVLVDKVEQVVRLIRSKGVGVYFVTQNPLDIPVDILGQLGNRIQHALRAFTPKDTKAIKTAAENFRPNPAFDTYKAITELGVGEALVSVLEENGAPSVVDRTLIRPPASRIGTITDAERKQAIVASAISGKYDKVLDRESAYERLSQRASEPSPTSSRSPWPHSTPRQEAPEPEPAPKRAKSSSGYQRQSYGEAVAKSVLRSVSSQVGRQLGNQIIRGVLGSILR
ncbi:MAG: helicase HerA-like domain-containing protein [Rickettsiales bacterium]